MESKLQQLEWDLTEAEDARMFGQSSLTSLRTLTAQPDATDADVEMYDSWHLNHQSHQMVCMYTQNKALTTHLLSLFISSSAYSSNAIFSKTTVVLYEKD